MKVYQRFLVFKRVHPYTLIWENNIFVTVIYQASSSLEHNQKYETVNENQTH